MRLLLDTHTFLFFVSNTDALPAQALAALKDPANQLHVSVVTPWEMQIKVGLGKLKLQKRPTEFVRFEVDRGGIALLPVSLAHIDELASLPPIHRDPFDRMLIAQSRREGLKLVSGDANVQRYPVDWLWG